MPKFPPLFLPIVAAFVVGGVAFLSHQYALCVGLLALTRIHQLGFVTRLPVVAPIWRMAVAILTPALISRWISAITPDGVASWLRQKTANGGTPMLRGDRLGAAQSTWPTARYGFLYKTIPADVRRSVVWDGRILGGYPVTWLAWRHLSADVVASAAKAAGQTGLRAGAIAAVLGVALIIAMTVSSGGYHAPVQYPAWSVGVSLMPRIEWYLLVGLDAVSKTVVDLALVLAAAALLTPALMFGSFWRLMHTWWGRATQALGTPTRDSLVIWKHKADRRESDLAAYGRQVDLAIHSYDAGQSLIKIGTAMGVTRARGEMRGPTVGQSVCLDSISIRQHTIIFGGTGEGKTEYVLKPMAQSIFSADWGTGHKIGGFITDGKGVLYQDFQELPAIAARDDVRILGTGEGQYGVNIVAGMSPLELSTMMSTITSQLSGESRGDIFWTEGAATIFFHAATIAQVLDLDQETLSGTEWQSYRPWSMMGIGRLATDARAMSDAVERVLALGEVPPEQLPGGMAELLYSDALYTSCIYLRGTWATMPNETKGGIIANVNLIVGKFGGAGALRDRFCTGRLPDDQVVDVDHALQGGIVMVAVGESDWGVVGKIIAIWLKTRLYVAARRKQRLDPESCKKTSVAIFADEFQMLATRGGAESDAEFYNIARSTGCFLVAATQSVASLQKSLGEKFTQDLLGNLRTKVCLRLEDQETLNFFANLAGQTMRGLVTDDAFYETQGQREIEMPDVTPDAKMEPSLSLMSLLPTQPSMPVVQNPAMRLDRRFLLGAGDANQAASVMGAEQAAYWRQEDREKDLRGAGLQERPLITADDLKQGSGFAFAYVQRAGGHTLDVVDLHTRQAA